MKYRLYIISQNKMTEEQMSFVEKILTDKDFYSQWLAQQTRLNSKAYQTTDIANIIGHTKDEEGNYWILVEGRRSPAKRLDTHFRVKFVKSMGNARPNNPKAKSHQGNLPFEICEIPNVAKTCLKDKKVLAQTLLEAKDIKAQENNINVNEIQYYHEGSLTDYNLLRHNRNRAVRDRCLKNSGGICYVCGFDFFKTYGKIGKGFLEVHHKNPIHNYTDSHVITVHDLCALCPNCHSMIHRTKQAMDVEELKDIVQRNKTK